MIADSAILSLPNAAFSMKSSLPECAGIYYVVDESNLVWYIGQAKNISKRWQGKSHHRIEQLAYQKQHTLRIYYERVEPEKLDQVEGDRIAKYNPRLNGTPVKRKTIRPTETLLRETLAAMSEFSFILGVEPPRATLDFDTIIPIRAEKKVLPLNVIHIVLDRENLEKKFNLQSYEESETLQRNIFNTRKSYDNKWKSIPKKYPQLRRLYVGGYGIEVTIISLTSLLERYTWNPEYIQTTLAAEPMRSLSTESLLRLQEKLADRYLGFSIKRLDPYTSELIKPIFFENIDREKLQEKLIKIGQEYRQGKRGLGSRKQKVNIDNFLKSQNIDIDKYRGEGIRKGNTFNPDKICLFIQCFDFDRANSKVGSSALGIINGRRTRTASSSLNTVYLLSEVNRKAWLLFEKYLQDFSKLSTYLLNEGEGYARKLYVSSRKYVEPARVNIKIQSLNYSVGIPFGISEQFPTFELAKEEIRQRLKHSNLPISDISFKPEKIKTK